MDGNCVICLEPLVPKITKNPDDFAYLCMCVQCKKCIHYQCATKIKQYQWFENEKHAKCPNCRHILSVVIE